MHINLEVLQGLERKMTVVVPSEKVEKTVDKKLQSLKGRVKIKGFRPNKAPDFVIRQQYGDSIRGEVINEVLSESYSDALKQEGLNPASMPKINLLKSEAGHPIEYEAVFEIYPTIELKTLDSVEVQGFTVEILDKDVDDLIQNILKQHTEWHEVDRPAQEHDRVEIDFDSLMDGETFKGGSGQNVSVILGSHTAIPGFEEGMIGAKAGDTLTLNLKFPDDYQNQKVAGKDTETKISVHQVFEPELPVLDDTFVEKLGIKEGVEGLKSQVRETLEAEAKKVIDNRIRSQVIEKFLDLNKIDLPQAMIDEEMANLKQQIQQKAKNSRNNSSDNSSEPSLEIAIRRVTMGLLFGEVIRVNNIELDDTKVNNLILELGKSYYDDPQVALEWYRKNTRQMQMLEASVLEEQVIEFLTKQATVVDEVVSYTDFVKKTAE
jgi:trigger factor